VKNLLGKVGISSVRYDSFSNQCRSDQRTSSKVSQTQNSTPKHRDRLDVLVTLVEAYEEKRWPIDVPDPVDVLAYAITTSVAPEPNSPRSSGHVRVPLRF
jgi:hypothetical protein